MESLVRMMPFGDCNIAGVTKQSSSGAGPAFNANGECLGMAFQSLSSDSAENIGYVIPTVGTPLLRKVLFFPSYGSVSGTDEIAFL